MVWNASISQNENQKCHSYTHHCQQRIYEHHPYTKMDGVTRLFPYQMNFLDEL